MPRHLEPSQPCACTSGKAFGDCCRPYLRGEREAPDPVSLMRSRFSAFALGYPDYLWRTLHASHGDRTRSQEEMLRSFRRATRTMEYRALTVLDSAPPDAAGRAQVLFLAQVHDRARDVSFLERSDFLHDGTGWRYANGTVLDASDFPAPEAVRLSTFGS
jgi:SEC-C motif-containing protein